MLRLKKQGLLCGGFVLIALVYVYLNKSALMSPSTKSIIAKSRLHQKTTHSAVHLNIEQLSWIPDMYERQDSGFVRVKKMPTYLHSALASNLTKLSQWDNFAIGGWEHTDEPYKCCFLFETLKIQFNEMMGKSYLTYANEEALKAKQFQCNRSGIDNGHVVGITLANTSQSCPIKPSSYLKVKYLYAPSRKTFCVSITNVHTNKDAMDLIEWIEFQKLFGVHKVLAYPVSNLNSEAVRVLLYYQLTGIVEIVPFYHVPEKDEHPREFSSFDSDLAYNDQQVAVYDSGERLKECSYAAIFDTDEFIMPTNRSIKSYVHLMDELLRLEPKTVGFTFKSHMHIKSWGAINASSELNIGKYLNRTVTMTDRPKQMFVPARVKQGGKTIHTIEADTGFSGPAEAPPSTVVIKHYRGCREDWSKHKCLVTFTRVTDTSIVPIVDKILPNVRHARDRIGL